MKEAIHKINDVISASGMISKMNVVKENADDETFKKLLYYILNPMITYKISEDRISSAPPSPSWNLLGESIFDVCEYLSKKAALTDEDVKSVKGFLEHFDEEEKSFYKSLLCRNIRLGVASKSVNKVVPHLIPEWLIQQAYPIEGHKIAEETWFSLTQKLNGVRATYFEGKLYARSGIPYEGLEHLIEEIEKATDGSLVLDGELTLFDKGKLSDNEAFRTSTGIINSDAKDKTEIGYTVFDVLPADEFITGESSKTYKERRAQLDELSKVLNGHVKVLPVLYSGEDQSKIAEYLDQMVMEDKEGLMLNLDVPYKSKRHSGILKVKRFYTMDLPIVRCEEGTGRLKGTLGAVVVSFKGNEVNVGSGFSDEQRKDFWEHKDELVGVLCEVKYKEISEDKKKGTMSLQFPIFVSLRKDKTEVSYG